ncbi:recombinase family protein [Faecalibacterium sp. I3-3-89]|uniref:recombinase family protein n=1 Tax=Faecalibacterium sp. I3-3-89 TaxID=2929493 RepID=UPI003FA54B25
MEKDKKVTALYCRLSKDDGSNSESLSIRTQKSMLMEYATRNGFGNCQYYVDDGYSGTNSDRPAFQELLDDIREGKVATVITKDQSRLGRNHIETGTYMEIFFPEHGVRYIAINDGYDSNEQSQMDIAPFRNIINEMYAKDTSRKIKSALRTRKKSGKYIIKLDKIPLFKRFLRNFPVALLVSKIRDRFLIVRTEEPLWQSLKRPSETRILTSCFGNWNKKSRTAVGRQI